jgi:hypothetical protein
MLDRAMCFEAERNHAHSTQCHAPTKGIKLVFPGTQTFVPFRRNVAARLPQRAISSDTASGDTTARAILHLERNTLSLTFPSRRSSAPRVAATF